MELGRALRARAAVVGAAMLLGVAAQPAEPPLSRAELEARYANEASRFLTVDGVRLHYVDQGSGPPLVLLHASYLNLDTWQPTADQLLDRFRVVRLDLPPAGLSGPDPRQAYSVDRNVELLAAFLSALELDEVALLGTSSGGIVAFRFAARHPERVSRLILINTAGLPRTAATNPLRASTKGVPGSRAFWEEKLAANFGDPKRMPGWLPEAAFDMNRREGAQGEAAIYLRNYDVGDPRAELARVSAPTLILWGGRNVTVSPLEAYVVQHWMTGAPTAVRIYDDLGHYPYLERPELVAADVGAFLTGGMDDRLRTTARLAPGARVCPPSSCERH